MFNFSFAVDCPLLDVDGAKLQKAARDTAVVSLARCVERHLSALPGRSYYAEASQAVLPKPYSDRAELEINHTGLRVQWLGSQKALGGDIMPVKKKFLAIPSALARGKRPRDFQNLEFVPIKNPKKAFWLMGRTVKPAAKKTKKAAKESKETPKAKPKFEVLFTLVSSATIRPHPHILPTQQQCEEAAAKGARSGLKFFHLFPN